MRDAPRSSPIRVPEMPAGNYINKLLPNQEFFRHLYRDRAPYEAALYGLMAAYARGFESSQFDLTTPAAVDFEEMSTPPWQLALFETLIALTGAKQVLEIGTFIGHSAMQLARMVGKLGHVTTIEIGAEFARIARDNVRRNGLAERVTVIEGDAGAVLDRLPKSSFDLIFVDGSKQSYLEYTLKSGDLLTERGVIVVDDVFFHGDALNAEPTTEKGRGCKRLLDHFESDNAYRKLLLPVANGVLILCRRNEGA